MNEAAAIGEDSDMRLAPIGPPDRDQIADLGLGRGALDHAASPEGDQLARVIRRPMGDQTGAAGAGAPVTAARTPRA